MMGRKKVQGNMVDVNRLREGGTKKSTSFA